MDDSAVTALPVRGASRGSKRHHPGLAALRDPEARSATADAAIFTLGSYGAQFLLFVAGVVQKGLLGPTATGYWALMATFYAFFNIAPLGSFDGAVRQVPFHRGRDDSDGAAEVANTSSSFTIVAVATFGLLASIVAFAFGGSWPPEVRYGLVLLGLTAPLRFLGDCHDIVIQSTKRFKASSLALITRAAVALTLQTLFVLLWGYYGMFAGVVAMTAGQLIVWNRMGLTSWRRPAFRWGIRFSRLKELMWFGFPIMVHGQIWLLFLAIDNLIVARFLDVTHLGYYALAVSVTTYIMLLPKSIGAVLAPRMAELFGRTREIGSIRHYATDVQRVLAYTLLPAFVAAAFFGMPVLITHALPDFAPAIPVVRITVAASFFLSLTSMPIKLVLTSGRQWGLVALMLCCLVVNGVANYLAVAVFDWGLKGAALAIAFSYFLLFLVTTSFALRRTLGTRRVIAHVIRLIVVFAYVTGALWGLEALLGHGMGGLVGDTLTALAKFTAFLILLTPWAVLVERRYKGITAMTSTVASGVRSLRRRMPRYA